MIVGVLLCANVVNVMDRSIVSVLIESIRRDFHLSDTEIGLLVGLSFFTVYSLLALPVSRIADRGHYRLVIAGSIVVWSLMTTVGGFAMNFALFASSRLGVAAGEAGLVPTAHALISRLFSEKRRGVALAVFSLAIPLGGALGAVVAGHLNQAAGWRVVMFTVGPVGLLLAPAVLLVVPKLERPLGRSQSFAKDAISLLRRPVYRYLWAGHAITTTYGYAIGAFAAPFLIRVHGLTSSQVGSVVAINSLIVGIAGIYAGGLLHDLVVRWRPWAGLLPSIVALIISAGITYIALSAANGFEAAFELGAALTLYTMMTVPAITMAMNFVPPTLRATSSAVMGLGVNIFGAALGPVIAGTLSDFLKTSGVPNPLGHAMMAMTAFEFFGVILFIQSLRFARRELA